MDTSWVGADPGLGSDEAPFAETDFSVVGGESWGMFNEWNIIAVPGSGNIYLMPNTPDTPGFGTNVVPDGHGGVMTDGVNFEVTSEAVVTPEPATWTLVLMGFVSLGILIFLRR